MSENTLIWVLCGVLGYILFRAWRRRKPKYCPTCRYQGPPRLNTRGSLLIEVILWCCFILPGVFYSMWRLSSKNLVCPQCGSPYMVAMKSEGEKVRRQEGEKVRRQEGEKVRT